MWEYRIEENLGVAELNKLGTQRWELITILDGVHVRKFYFKRLNT